MAERKDVEFKTYDGITLRAWFFGAGSNKAPCIVMVNGVSISNRYLLFNQSRAC